MLLPKSICLCIPFFKSVVPRVCMTKVPFCCYFFGPDMKADIPQIILFPNIYIHIYIYIYIYIGSWSNS